MTYQHAEPFKYRASYRVYLAYKINKHELWMLVQLSGLLALRRREIIARNDFFQELTGNSRMKTRLLGYFYGLLAKGFIGTYEYIGKPGSICLGISNLGHSALALYESELNKIISNVKPRRVFGRHHYREVTIPIDQQKILSKRY